MVENLRWDVEVEVFNRLIDSDGIPFTDLVEEASMGIPSEFLGKAEVALDYVDNRKHLIVTYWRPETDEEMAERIATQECEEREFRERTRKQELAQLKFLRGKYPND